MFRTAIVSLGLVIGAMSFAADPIWLEGESAVTESANFSVAESPAFSGGKMLRFTANADRINKNGDVATWKLSVPTAGEYEFWGRLGYRPWTDFQWRIGEGEWRTASSAAGFFEFLKVPIKQGGVTEVCWAPLGKVKLDAGELSLQVRMSASPRQNYVLQSFDCLVFSAEPFTPAGQYEPGEEIAARPTGNSGASYWPIAPYVESSASRVIDLSFMNEPAEKRGFVKMVDGDLQFADGTPVRFFGPNVSFWQGNLIYMDHMAADRFADLVSRLGANCVRIHIMHATNSLIDPNRDDTQEVDAGKLDRLEYLIAALAKRNIYINLDLMFHRTFKKGDGVGEELVRVEGQPEDPKYNLSWASGAAAFWHPRVIELNLALYQKLLTRQNPYTGKRLVDMPEMAMCTIHNEQSVFWGTTNMRKGETAQLLDQQYTQWLKNKYKTHAQLVAAWQVEGQGSPFNETENLDDGTIAVGNVVQSPAGASRNRAADQVRFLYDVETGFYTRWIEAMRGWGVKCPIITSNWQGSAHTTRLVLQASTLGDIVDRHIYFTRPQTMLDSIGKGLPMIGFDQQAGRAFCVSEWNHGENGRYQAETVPLMATIGAIQGWDALFQFCAVSPTFPSIAQSITPGHLATYPIAAMIFRRGDIQTGPLVFERRRDPAYQFSFQNENRLETTDPAALRFADPAQQNQSPRVPPQLLAIGRVQNAYVDKPTPDLFDSDIVEKGWDRQANIASSAAGDIKWNAASRFVQLDSPRTQGVFGAMAGKQFNTEDTTISAENEHAAIVVTSLSNDAIAQSRHLLVVAVSNSVPNSVGFPNSPPTAAPPALMEGVKAVIAIKTPLHRVHTVSLDGRRTAPVPAQRDGQMLRFEITPDQQAFWYEVSE